METKGMHHHKEHSVMMLGFLSVVSLTATTLFVLTGCISPLPPASIAPENQPLPLKNEVGISLDRVRDELSVTSYLFPIDVVTNSAELTEASIGALSTAFTNSVQVELALVKVPDQAKWDLFHTSKSLTATITLWQEYLSINNQSGTVDNVKHSERTLWDAYLVRSSNQLTIATNSVTPPTLAAWINVVNDNSGRNSEDITKLLFSVKVGNMTKYVLYTSDMLPTGQPPDGGNTCSGSRSGGLYCTFVRWWG